MPTSIPPPHALQQRDGERSRHRGRRDELLGGVPGEEVTGRQVANNIDNGVDKMAVTLVICACKVDTPTTPFFAAITMLMYIW